MSKASFDPSIMHKKNYPFFERIFYRPAASPLVILAAKSGLGPTRVNIIGFLLGLTGIILVALGGYKLRAIGGSLLVISYILDCVDGQLARALKQADKFGALFDTTLDSIKESLIFFALAWTHYLQTQNKYVFLYLAAILFLQRMFGRTMPWYRLIFRQGVEEIERDTIERSPKSLRFAAAAFSEAYRSGTIWIVVLIGVLTNQIIPTFIYFIVVLSALFLFLLSKAFREGRITKK